ncbi:hypothetical protein SAMN02949497_3476 [Methylomagnum ishizawai]|uniref:PIN domain-containing protein n=2 Tax=Methylomagnum ishizawai TaxID=1760988 RepID=A0A1Y6D5F5_9GAMM|nr:hypothetical protein SAMN02949497_3476 [Methylomagnum ishizawai]
MQSVYIESSVISYITARPSRDIVVAARQAITIEWWNEYKSSFETFISELVLQEIASGDTVAANNRLAIVENIPILEATERAKALAEVLLSAQAVPASSTEDALHIAIAAVQNIDFLLTWNFKHINNANTRDKIAKIIRQFDYKSPILCSPEELINER